MRDEIPAPESTRREVGPLPPDDLVVRTGVNPRRFVDAEERRRRFDDIGRDVYAHVSAVLSPDWEWPGKAVLDFGCGSGRLLRWLLSHVEDGATLAGCDIHEPSIRWLRENYPAAVRLYVNDPEPRLPEGDDVFDLVCAVSVFTHLTNWAPWLLELRRVLKPGGILVASILGKGSWESGAAGARGVEWDEDRTGLLVEQYGAGFDDGYGPAVFASEWWLREHWGRALDIDRVESGGQVWVQARKRLDGHPPSTIEELVAPGDDAREALAALRAQWLAYEELASVRGDRHLNRFAPAPEGKLHRSQACGEAEREDVEDDVAARDAAGRVALREPETRNGGRPRPGSERRSVEFERRDDQEHARIDRHSGSEKHHDQKGAADRAGNIARQKGQPREAPGPRDRSRDQGQCFSSAQGRDRKAGEVHEPVARRDEGGDVVEPVAVQPPYERADDLSHRRYGDHPESLEPDSRGMQP